MQRKLNYIETYLNYIHKWYETKIQEYIYLLKPLITCEKRETELFIYRSTYNMHERERERKPKPQ